MQRHISDPSRCRDEAYIAATATQVGAHIPCDSKWLRWPHAIIGHNPGQQLRLMCPALGYHGPQRPVYQSAH
eukprot:14463-Heterococcus_DN1.PRE.3